MLRDELPRIAIIAGSTRPGRQSDSVGEWILARARRRDDAEFEGGVRAVEQLRSVLGELQIADTRASVALTFDTDFEHFTTFRPRSGRDDELDATLESLLAWTTAMRTLRTGTATAAP